MIAQELQKIYPELVLGSNNEYLSIDYGKFTAVLLQSVKELKNQMKAMQDQIRITLAIFTALGLILASALLPTSDVSACTCGPPPCDGSCTCYTCTPVAGNPDYTIPVSMTSSYCTGGVTTYTLPYTDTGGTEHNSIPATLSTDYMNVPTEIPGSCLVNQTCNTTSHTCVCTYNQCLGVCCASGKTCIGPGGSCGPA